MARNIIVGICICCCALALFWLSLQHHKDSDPDNFYAVLDLPQGVPLRVSIAQVDEAFEASIESVQSLEQKLGCAGSDHDDMEHAEQLEFINTPDEDMTCDELHMRSRHLHQAHRVLGTLESKVKYDSGERTNPRKNFYEVLGLERGASLEELRAGFRIKKAEFETKRDELCATDAKATVECRAATDQLAAVIEAATVLGDPDSLRAYDGEADVQQSLRFVTDPLALVQQASSPLTFLVPIMLTCGVLWMISKEAMNREAADQAATGDARHADPKQD